MTSVASRLKALELILIDLMIDAVIVERYVRLHPIALPILFYLDTLQLLLENLAINLMVQFGSFSYNQTVPWLFSSVHLVLHFVLYFIDVIYILFNRLF